jgi:hypothetical protein
MARAVYSTDAAVHVYETFTDYDFHWLGKWHDVFDRRDNYNFEWVTREEDVFGTVPSVCCQSLRRYQSCSRWNRQSGPLEPIIQQQTVLITERIEQTGPALAGRRICQRIAPCGYNASPSMPGQMPALSA